MESVAKIGPSWLTLVLFFFKFDFAAKIHLATIATRAGQAELAEFHLKVVRLGLGRCFA